MQVKRHDQVSVKLKSRDRQKIVGIISKGQESGRRMRRALILRLMDQGCVAPEVAQTLGVTAKCVRDIAHKYQREGLKAALSEKPRPGQPAKLSSRQINQIVALVCSSPPDGYSRWTIRLLVKEVIQRKIAKETNRESLRLILKNHDLKPWLKKNVVRSGTER